MSGSDDHSTHPCTKASGSAWRKKETNPPTAKVGRSVENHLDCRESVPLRKAPDDHEECDYPSKAVASDLIDERDEVLCDRREVPTLVWAEDDVDHNTKCDQYQCEIYNVLRPVFDLLNRVHISFFSRQVINAHPPKGVGVLGSIRAARSTPSTSTCLRDIGRVRCFC